MRLGVIDRENPPFEILGTGLSFEGITADYASLLAAQLRLQVKVKVYTSLGGAIKGLREGDIDLLGSMTLEQAKAQGLRLSRPYVSDAPTLLAPSMRAPLDTRQAVRLAMVDGYRAPDQVEAAFPQAQLQTFPSPASALAALSLGQADLYLGSALGVRYVLGRNESGGFEEVGRASLPEQMLGFAMAEGASPLADLIDIALDSLSVSQRLEVSKRWRPKGKGLELLLDTQGPVDTQVMLDPLRFKQVLANLLSNAVKFTPQGHVRVWVRALQDETRLLVELHVEDTGIGIDAAELDALGQPFRQASNQRQSARCSAGLGLGISRSLCQMMGGDLKLHSVLGQGTRVELNLDLALAPEREQALPANAPPDLAGELRLRVLVVDDYPANRLLLAQQLDFLGHHARVAEDGSQALRLWLKEHFDVVISDCNMPQLNGYALARAIREHERRSGRSRCRLIGLTASAMTRERRRCRAVGMDDCLFKPLGLDSLQRALADGMRQQNAEQPMLDLEHLQRLVNRDQAALKALLGDLRSSNREDLQRLEAVGNDASALAELAHRVKGGARIARADRLYDRCEQLERSCTAQPLDVERLRSDVQALRRMMMQLEHQLARMPTHGFPG